MINGTNYHKYLEDFIAGKLDPSMEEAFMAFLDQHPEILDESNPLSDETSASLEPEFIISLKKNVPVDGNNIDEWLIADLEGDLSVGEVKELEQFVSSNPSYKKDRELYAATRLDISERFEFKGKESLKKRPVFVLYPTVLRVAAAVIILMGLWFVIKPGGEVPDQVADINPVTVVPDSGNEQKTPAKELAQEEKELVKATPVKVKPLLEPERNNIPGNEEVQPVANKNNPQMPQPKPSPFERIDEDPEKLVAKNIPVAVPGTNTPEEESPVLGRNLTVVEWAYKQVRRRVSNEEKEVPQQEISKDMAHILSEKLSPVIGISKGNIRIGNITWSRKTETNEN